MRYAALGGGKRLRAALVYATGEALGGGSTGQQAATTPSATAPALGAAWSAAVGVSPGAPYVVAGSAILNAEGRSELDKLAVALLDLEDRAQQLEHRKQRQVLAVRHAARRAHDDAALQELLEDASPRAPGASDEKNLLHGHPANLPSLVGRTGR